VLQESNLISVAVRKLQISNSHNLVIDILNPCVGVGLIQGSGEGMRNGRNALPVRTALLLAP
jgi:hypothetical protein